MARNDVWSFIQAIRASPQLQARCRALGQQREDLVDFVALGQENGCHFTEADAAAYFGEAIAAGDGELSNEELGRVSGGVGIMPLKVPISVALFARSSPPSRLF